MAMTKATATTKVTGAHDDDDHDEDATRREEGNNEDQPARDWHWAGSN